MLAACRARLPVVVGLFSRPLCPGVASRSSHKTVLLTPGEPRTPRNPYTFFIKDFFQKKKAEKETSEETGEPLGDFQAKSGEAVAAWNDLEPEKKKVYEEMANKHNAARFAAIQGGLLVPKRPGTGLSMFVSQRHEAIIKESPDTPTKGLFAKVVKEWTTLSAEEKELYNAKAKEALEAYHEEMKAFTDSLDPVRRPLFEELQKLKKQRPYLPNSIYNNALKTGDRSLLKALGLLQDRQKIDEVKFPAFVKLNKSQRKVLQDLEETYRDSYYRVVRKLEQELGLVRKAT